MVINCKEKRAESLKNRFEFKKIFIVKKKQFSNT